MQQFSEKRQRVVEAASGKQSKSSFCHSLSCRSRYLLVVNKCLQKGGYACSLSDDSGAGDENLGDGKNLLGDGEDLADDLLEAELGISGRGKRERSVHWN